MFRRILILAIAAQSHVVAQETMTFSFEFAHPVLSPGQVQQVSVWAHMQPGIGAPAAWTTSPWTGQMGNVAGFANAWFDILNVANAHTGAYSALQLHPMILGEPGVAHPTGTVFGLSPYQFVGPAVEDNPIRLWTAIWTPNHYEPRSIELDFRFIVAPRTFLWIGPGAPVQDEWIGIGIPGSFQVVPAPTAGVVAAIGLASMYWRRSRTARSP